MFPVLDEHVRCDHFRPCQEREHQRQLERESKGEEELHVEIHVGADGQLGRQLPIHSKPNKEFDDQRKNDEVAEGKAQGK